MDDGTSRYQNPMACSSDSLFDQDRRDHVSMRVLVTSVNKYILQLLENPGAWSALKLRCETHIKFQTQEFFEFSDQSVLSNLYWGIESIESAVKESVSDEIISKLEQSELMLQAPALLNEEEFTAGIPNEYVICFSYIYLSVLKRLQNHELQVALHFLQALIVSPRLVLILAEELCGSLIPWCIRNSQMETGKQRGLGFTSDEKLREKDFEETIKKTGRRYKDQLMYHLIMQYGETPQWPDQLNEGSLIHNHKQCSKQEATSKKDVPERQCFFKDIKQPSSERKSIRDILEDMSSPDSCNEDYATNNTMDEDENHIESERASTSCEDITAEFSQQKQEARCLGQNLEGNVKALIPRPRYRSHEAKGVLNNFVKECKRGELCASKNHIENEEHTTGNKKQSQFNHFLPRHQGISRLQIAVQGVSKTEEQVSLYQRMKDDTSTDLEMDSTNELEGMEDAISKLVFSRGLQNYVEDQSLEMNMIYETLNDKVEVTQSLLKDVLVDLLLTQISTSKEMDTVRASISILSKIVLHEKSSVEEMKKKGLRLEHLTTALKSNVYEAAVLIYLINPSPTDLKNLELLPTLLEVVCSSVNQKSSIMSPLPTPPVASLIILEVLVTAFDHETNVRNLAQISSPRILSALLEVARDNDIGEFISLTSVLTQAMRFDEKCRQYIIQYFPMLPFIFLLQSSNKQAWIKTLEFFHETLHAPRSSVVSHLQRIRNQGSHEVITYKLMLCLQQLDLKYKLIAANLMLHLDILDDIHAKSRCREEAIRIILELATLEECSDIQILASSILSNLGGTYSWGGEPYTTAWLVKKTSLASLTHRNYVNIDWQDEALQDAGIDSWSRNMARSFLKVGNYAFNTLAKGLRSSKKKVSKDCLTTISWIGCEVARNSNIKVAECEISLKGVEKFLHPGFDLEERLLACLSIYNYGSVKGMQKVIHFSEGVKESLRRLSNITWMADELLKVADYIHPYKSQRISCVHTQILEVGQNSNVAVSALIYYKGQLYSGHSEGSIKAWELKGHCASLVLDVKEHKKAVTCFSLTESGNLLSGSADKTIRVWKRVQTKLECVEVIVTTVSIESLATYGQQTFFISKKHNLKVLDASRAIKDACKTKRVKCMQVVPGKVYLGCTDSSIQELNIKNYREREIKKPTRSWRLHSTPINSISIYKDWFYSASTVVEGSHIKEWRTHEKPRVLIVHRDSSNLLGMAVVEDFIYLNSSTSPNVLQIWLRGSRQKVGRLSAGSKITSILAANDMIICGTESGLIKGWLPL